MADPYIGEIRIFGFNFAPVDWAMCNGQLIAISQNSTLFSIIGTSYGGNGTSSFGLPNFQSRVPIGTGQGPGLSPRVIGEEVGSNTVSLLSSEMPAHTHLMNNTNANNNADLVSVPVANYFLSQAEETAPSLSVIKAYSSTTTPTTTLAPQSVGLTGGSQPHQNEQPYLTLNYCISLYGIYPSKS